MSTSKTRSGAVRRPPTNAKLVQLLEELDASRDDIRARIAARDGIQKLYLRGLPRGLDPAVVTATIAEAMPHGAEIQRLTKVAGAEYDEAIVAGVRRYRERIGVQHVLEVTLAATLAEHGGVTFAAAYEQLRYAEEQVGRDFSTNLPADRSAAVLERVSAAMDAWFAPEVVAHTLALAHDGMPPTAWSDGRGATPPQGDEEWALFIACALHPSDAAAAVLAARCALVPRLDEPGRAAVLDVLRYAHRVHGARVPLPPG